jgi:hypothetical protein
MELEKPISEHLYTGSKYFHIAPGKKIDIQSFEPVTITPVDESGEIQYIPIKNNRIITRSPGSFMIEPDVATAPWMIKFVYTEGDPADPEPLEIGIPEPMTLRERIQEVLQEVLINQFGTQSKEVETWQEAQDFLMDETDNLLSPYELLEMEPEELAQPVEEPAPSSGSETQPEPVSEPVIEPT